MKHVHFKILLLLRNPKGVVLTGLLSQDWGDEITFWRGYRKWHERAKNGTPVIETGYQDDGYNRCIRGDQMLLLASIVSLFLNFDNCHHTFSITESKETFSLGLKLTMFLISFFSIAMNDHCCRFFDPRLWCSLMTRERKKKKIGYTHRVNEATPIG
jgi:hypothetical protein